MVLQLSDLRTKLDLMAEAIVGGLKDRSRNKLNSGVFTKEFTDGKTWFDFRLFGEQNLDAQFGRFEFPDQYPLLYKKSELVIPIHNRVTGTDYIENVEIDISDKVVSAYRNILPSICKNEENQLEYGETAKCDVNNILLLNERINLGRFVAESKLIKEPELIKINDDKILESRLRNLQREEDVINKARVKAFSYELNPEVIEKYFRWIMDETIKVEITYIRKRK